MFSKILVPLDGSSLSERALPIAVLIAQATNASLVLVRAVWTRGLTQGLNADAAYPLAMHEAEAYLETVARRLNGDGMMETAVTHAPASQGILQVADQFGADLIVMTTHGRSGVSRWVYGSVAEAVLAHSRIPVLLVRMQETPAMRTERGERPRLLLPLDGSSFAETALPIAAALARALNWTVVLVRVVAPPATSVNDPELQRPFMHERLLQQTHTEAEHYLQSIAQQLQADGVQVKLWLRVGEAAAAILEEGQASGASLIVMATHGRTGLGRLLYGSVAGEVLHKGTLPLLLVRPKSIQAAYKHALLMAVE